jgi:hypothetical protein
MERTLKLLREAKRDMTVIVDNVFEYYLTDLELH